ncbi:MAG: dihydroorotate dehydrogenase electron transfer subunit, partial [Deferribacterales bacterium]
MEGIVIENRKLNNKYYYMIIKSPEFCKGVKPGQFFMIQPKEFDYIYDPLLRRPFGICDIDEKNGCFSLLYMVVGKGTKLLTTIKEGVKISFSKPVGNSFTLFPNKNIALVGGGIGIAPLYFLCKELKTRNCRITLYFGGQSKEDIVFLDEF